MGFVSAEEKRAKEFADKYGFSIRRVPHSKNNPNGFIKVTGPNGEFEKAQSMVHALEIMRNLVYGTPSVPTKKQRTRSVELLLNDDLREHVEDMAKELKKHGETGMANEKLAYKVLPHLQIKFPDLFFDDRNGSQRFVTAKGKKTYEQRLKVNRENYVEWIENIDKSLAAMERHFKNYEK
ncbi:hypothetical protein ABES02_29275 [Neobacillus pocheonensis]|uniref:hypothetical protein n=1 Tax=Neobacillus pocheonensis TaxID=363869 RepID=UPI003D29C22E